MIAADRAVQRPTSARLLVVDAAGRVTQSPRARWLDFVEQSPRSLDAQRPDDFRIPLQAAVALFAEAVDVAYRAVADEMSSVRRRQETRLK